MEKNTSILKIQSFKDFTFHSIIIILIMVMFFSCENDIKTINSLTGIDSLPLEIAYDVEIYFSDSGKLQAVLKAPIMERIMDEEEYLEFSKGFHAIFYDSVANPESEITAKYGINWEKKKMMEAKHNVVVKNIKKQEQLNTEHLIWDRKKRTIYSEVFITLTKPDEVLYGDGFTSDENFDAYEVINPTGEFNVYQDDDEKNKNK